MITPGKKKINWEILSLTRFLLALIVAIGHMNGFANIGFLKWYSSLGSFEAILGFLLISGFSIGHSVSRHKKDYFKRRMQRIYPVYVVSIIFQLIVTNFHFTLNASFIVLLNLIFLNHVFIGYSLVGPAWTLATEVWLYCLAPIFLKLKDKWLTVFIYFSFCSYVLYTCGRTLFHWNYYDTTSHGINLITLGFIWMAGFKFCVSAKRSENNLIIILLLIGHITLSACIQIFFRIEHKEEQLIFNDLMGYFTNTICLTVAYIPVVYNAWFPAFSNFVSKIFNFLGNISYPLYLTHATTFLLLQKWGESNTVILLISALFVSCLVYWLFDFYSKKRVVKFQSLSIKALAL